MRRPRSVVVAGVVASAVAAAIAILPSTPAQAAAAKPKPVVGQLVMGGATSPVTAYSWDVTAVSNWTSGGASVGKPAAGAFRCTKLIDAGSIPALLKITTGTAFPSVVFTVSSGKGNGASTMVYEMEDVLVTGVSQRSAEGLATEDVTFVFKFVRWTFTSAAGEVTTGTWDVVSGAAS